MLHSPTVLAWLLLPVLFVAGLLFGARLTPDRLSGSQTAAALRIPGISEQNYPRVDGSTSTIPLGSLLINRVLGLRGELRRLPAFYGGEGSTTITFPLGTDTATMKHYFDVVSRKSHNGTHGSYLNLLSDDAPSELLLVARKPSPDELAEARKYNIEYEIRPLALDALVFIVNEKNSLSALTIEQIRAIYAGKITDWQDVGGEKASISVFARDRNSGSEELMRELVMHDTPTVAQPQFFFGGMEIIIRSVAETPLAIGYSVYYYETLMAPDTRNKRLSINGIAPTRETIANRSYPLTAEVYAVIRKGLPETHPARILRDWLLSPDGQKLVADSGYTPIR